MENSLLAIGPIFEQLYKFVKNKILIEVHSKFQRNISACISIRKNYKNGVAIFDEFWPNTLYYSTGTLA